MSAGGHNRIPDTVRKRALKLVADGYTGKQAAEKLGISETAVWNWMRKKRAQESVPVELSEGIKMLHAWPRGSE